MRSARSVLSRVQNHSAPPQTIVKLSEWETNLFRFLRRVAGKVNQTPAIQLRVAGGWVRDKLLSRPTGDIDIAIRNTTGYLFANLVSEYAKRATCTPTLDGKPQQGCVEYVPEVSGMATIEPNPAMSRHLQTASVRIDGNDLDFVELRTETYAKGVDTRVPKCVAPGTPYEDAHRRDFTINALFYNLHTGTVEDLTGKGLGDLWEGVIRTPLAPGTTLEEDPLRSLRALRFACCLKFRLDPCLESALCAGEVRNGLCRKVSRERIGIEMLQILESPDAVRGLEMLGEFQLVRSVFSESFREGANDAYEGAVGDVRQAIETAEASVNVLSDSEFEGFREYGRLVVVLAALGRDESRCFNMIREDFRRGKRLEKEVCSVVMLSNRLAGLVEAWREAVDSDGGQEKEKEAWIDMAEVIREAGEELWVSVVVLCAVRMNDGYVVEELVKSGISGSMCRERPIVKGGRLRKELGIEPGPMVGKAIRELLRIQLWNYRVESRDRRLKHEGCDGETRAELYMEILREKRYLFETRQL